MRTNTIATAVAGMALVFSMSAHAQSFFELEAGIGGSGYSHGEDGYWVQDGFEHKLQLTAPSFELGLTGDLYQARHWGLSYHVDWAWLGTIHTQSYAVADALYNTETQSCNGPCGPKANFVGSGHEQGFLFALEPHYDVAGWRIGVEGGPFIHRATWTEDVTGFSFPYIPNQLFNFHMVSTDGWRIGAVAGASIAYKNFSLVYQHFFVNSTSSNAAPPIWHSVDMMTLMYKANVL